MMQESVLDVLKAIYVRVAGRLFQRYGRIVVEVTIYDKKISKKKKSLTYRASREHTLVVRCVVL